MIENSIIFLDDHPEDIIDQFVVAAHVGMNPTGTALMARSTSMMPNKLGLGAILAMAFSPKVEMRIDKRQERYTGCLTGKIQIRKKVNYSYSNFSIFSCVQINFSWGYFGPI